MNEESTEERGDLQRRLGPYRLIKHLGSGGMGDIYLARQTTVGREVAIKILPRDLMDDPDASTRFRREIHILGQLSHPHIPAGI